METTLGERSDMAPEKLESDANVSPLRTSDLIDAARQDSAHAKILVQQLVEAGEWPAPDLLDQIVIAGDAAVGPLLEMLRAIPKTRPDPHVVRNVMGLLTALSPQEVITELVHLVQHADVEHSGDAADALGRCGDAGFNALVELCESDSLKGYRRAGVFHAAAYAALDKPARKSRLAGILRRFLDDAIDQGREELKQVGLASQAPGPRGFHGR